MTMTTTRRKARRYPKGVHVFNLHPERDSLYHRGSQGTCFVRVLVFPSREHMYAYCELDRDHEGCCMDISVTAYRKGKKPRRSPITTEVCLSRDHLGISVVSHELFHATISYARHFVFNFCRLDARDSVNEQEEWIAHVHSNLCRLFMQRAIKAGIYRELPTAVRP